MELKYQLLTEKEFNNSFLNLTHKPFFFDFIRGVVLINREMPHLERIMVAVSACWQFDLLDEKVDAIFSRAYETIKQVAGNIAAEQFIYTWRDAGENYRKQKDLQAAEMWIDETFLKMGDKEWDALYDGGYSGGFLDAIRTIFHNRDMAGDKRYNHSFSMWKDAIFAYAFHLGREAARREAH